MALQQNNEQHDHMKDKMFMYLKLMICTLSIVGVLSYNVTAADTLNAKIHDLTSKQKKVGRYRNEGEYLNVTVNYKDIKYTHDIRVGYSPASIPFSK